MTKFTLISAILFATAFSSSAIAKGHHQTSHNDSMAHNNAKGRNGTHRAHILSTNHNTSITHKNKIKGAHRTHDLSSNSTGHHNHTTSATHGRGKNGTHRFHIHSNGSAIHDHHRKGKKGTHSSHLKTTRSHLHSSHNVSAIHNRKGNKNVTGAPRKQILNSKLAVQNHNISSVPAASSHKGPTPKSNAQPKHNVTSLPQTPLSGPKTPKMPNQPAALGMNHTGPTTLGMNNTGVYAHDLSRFAGSLKNGTTSNLKNSTSGSTGHRNGRKGNSPRSNVVGLPNEVRSHHKHVSKPKARIQ